MTADELQAMLSDIKEQILETHDIDEEVIDIIIDYILRNYEENY